MEIIKIYKNLVLTKIEVTTISHVVSWKFNLRSFKSSYLNSKLKSDFLCSNSLMGSKKQIPTLGAKSSKNEKFYKLAKTVIWV